MALIKRADIEQYTRDSYVLDLGDLERKGQAVTQAARSEAEQILRVAKAKSNQMVTNAKNQGHDQGYKEGLEKGYGEGLAKGVEQAHAEHAELLEQLENMWASQLDAFEQQRDTMLDQARTQIVELGAMIAQRVTRRVIELDSSVVLKQMEAILSSMTETTRLVLTVHPDDIDKAQSALPKMIERFAVCEHAQIVTDAALEPGSCIARSAAGGVIDASIPTQLDRIINALLPGNEPQSKHAPLSADESRAIESDDGEADEQPRGDAA
jgi:flagellar assembly protein FliH